MNAQTNRFNLLIRGLALAMVLAASLGAAAITLSAKGMDECAGLGCYAQQDCGSYCFCNRPSGFCYLDAP